MKWTYEIITLFTELKLIRYIGHKEMLKIFQFWHTHSIYVHNYRLYRSIQKESGT